MAVPEPGNRAPEETRRRSPALGRPWLPRLAVVLAVATSLPGWAFMASAAGLPAGGMPGLRVPLPGQSSDLFGEACTSPSNCWAVGRYEGVNGADLNQVLHWNGSAWSLASTPDPGGDMSKSVSQLFGAACTSASSCWAVGNYVNSTGAGLNEALHWNGAKWSLVSTPQPGGTSSGVSEVQGIRCTSASNCWAAGSYLNASGAILNQVLHWNGAKWSLVPTPQPGGSTSNLNLNILNAVGCTSASNCWAGGYDTTARDGTAATLNEVLHWNGAKWSLATTPDPGGTVAGDVSAVNFVSCASASSCWAVGRYGTASPHISLNEALFWNGTSWSLVSTPDPDGTGGANELNGVTCTSSGNCWAVGDYGSISGGAGVVVNQALHWNGAAWSLVSTPDPGGLSNNDSNVLLAVRCATSAHCLAVGDVSAGGGADQNQALFWNGTAWTAG